MTLLAIILASRGEKVLFVMPKYSMIRTVLMPLLKEHLVALGIHEHTKLTTSPAELQLNSGIVWFVSGEAVDTMRGITCSALLMDECGTITDECYKVALGRNRGQGSGYVRLGGTPTGAGHWFSDLICTTYTQSVIANKFVPKAFKKSLIEKYGGLDNKWAKQELLGEVVDMSGSEQLISNFVIENAFNNPCHHDGNLWIGLDLARKGNDDSAIAILDGNHIKQVITRHGLEGHQIKEWLKEVLYNTGCRNVIVDVAGIGGLFYDELKDQLKGVNFVEFNGAHSPIDKRMYVNKRAESWDTFNQWLRKDGSLVGNTAIIRKELCAVNKMYQGGKLLLESKDKMVKSPDGSDAMVMAVYAQKHELSKQDHEDIGIELYGF